MKSKPLIETNLINKLYKFVNEKEELEWLGE